MNTIILGIRRGSYLDKVNRIVSGKMLVGTLLDGRQCWRGEIQLNRRPIAVEVIGSKDSEVWYPLYTQFQRWKRRKDGEQVHEEDWHHYPDNVWTGEIALQELDKQNKRSTVELREVVYNVSKGNGVKYHLPDPESKWDFPLCQQGRSSNYRGLQWARTKMYFDKIFMRRWFCTKCKRAYERQQEQVQ